MLTPSQEQWLGQLRQLLPVLGTLLTTFGIMKPDSVSGFITLIMVIAGPIMIVVSSVWSFFDKTQASMVAKVDAMAKDKTSPVLGIMVANTPEGRELAMSMPGKETAIVGTADAKSMVA